MQEPEQLVEGSMHVGIQAGPQSMYSALGGHGSVHRKRKTVDENFCNETVSGLNHLCQNYETIHMCIILGGVVGRGVGGLVGGGVGSVHIKIITHENSR